MQVLRRMMLRLGAQQVLTEHAGDPNLTEDQRQVLSRLADHQDLLPMMVATLNDGLDAQPQGVGALRDVFAPGKPHPFLQWLVKGGGAQWIYQIARLVASLFGVPLPSLPELPAPPPLK